MAEGGAVPQWLAARAAWSKPADPMVVRRRARGRAAYNRFRQQQAQRRRQALWTLWCRLTGDGQVPIAMAALYAALGREWVVSKRQFWRDVAALRASGYQFPSLAQCRAERAERRFGRTHGGVWARRFLALELALCQTVPRDVVALVKRRAAELVQELSAVPGAASVFEDGTPAGSGDAPAMPWSAAGQAASAPPPAPLTPEAPRAGRPAEFSGQPGTAERLVRQPHHPRQTSREREWWES